MKPGEKLFVTWFLARPKIVELKWGNLNRLDPYWEMLPRGSRTRVHLGGQPQMMLNGHKMLHVPNPMINHPINQPLRESCFILPGVNSINRKLEDS